ncbi:MAG TPA: zinc ribbon domain-containing protein [Candidatus Flavonifractor merdigallinarum]|uniref:Zinc ribbon domain-containing protein n=1 Tax=Candidatus Flavonifractor merdigallinarum TaxID=2838589 RepID=A0A9D1YA12_9FIRM|nr:zinc ribbon domain-containing protein [Candidatus Flavonifractor merdigallinarum]
MKVCPNCGQSNEDRAAFCRFCGSSLASAQPEAAPSWNGASYSGAQQTADPYPRFQEPTPAPEGMDNQTPPDNSHSALLEPDEHVVSSIGSNYLQNFLAGGSIHKSVGVLTQKRFYYKGRNFNGPGKLFQHTTEEGVVSLEDITFTAFTHIRYTGILFLAILLTIVPLVLLAMENDHIIGFVCLIAAILLYLLYFLKRQTLFLVSFPGGGFAFDVRWYPIADIRSFQRQLHLLKDGLKHPSDEPVEVE